MSGDSKFQYVPHASYATAPLHFVLPCIMTHPAFLLWGVVEIGMECGMVGS